MNNQNNPLLLINQDNQRNNDIDSLMYYGGTVVVPIFNNQILVAKRSVAGFDDWSLVKDVPDQRFELMNGQIDYCKTASRIMDICFGIRYPDSVIDLGPLCFESNRSIHLVKYQINNNFDLNQIRFAYPDGITGGDLVNFNKLIDLINKGTVRDIFTLSAIPFLMTNQ